MKDLYKWWYPRSKTRSSLVNERLTTNKKIAMRVQVNNRLISSNTTILETYPNVAKESAKKDIDYIIDTYGQYFPNILKETLFPNDIKKQLS